MLDLVEEARLVDRRRGVRGEGPRGLGMLGGVEVLFELVQSEHPDQAIADEQRYAQPSLDASLAMRLLVEVLEARRHVGDDDWLALLDHVRGGVVRIAPVEPLPEQFVEVREPVPADDDHLVAVDLLHAAAVVRNHLAQFRQDEIEDLGEAQEAPERLGRRPQ